MIRRNLNRRARSSKAMYNRVMESIAPKVKRAILNEQMIDGENINPEIKAKLMNIFACGGVQDYAKEDLNNAGYYEDKYGEWYYRLKNGRRVYFDIDTYQLIVKDPPESDDKQTISSDDITPEIKMLLKQLVTVHYISSNKEHLLMSLRIFQDEHGKWYYRFTNGKRAYYLPTYNEFVIKDPSESDDVQYYEDNKDIDLKPLKKSMKKFIEYHNNHNDEDKTRPDEPPLFGTLFTAQ